MKQVYWITPNLANGGAERVTAVLADAFAEKNWRSAVVFMKDDHSQYPLGERVERLYLHGSGGTLRRVSTKIIRLRKLMRKNPQAIFVAMLPYETLYAFLAGFLLKTRIVYSLRNDPANMTGRIHRIITRIIYPRASCVVFQTPDAMAYFPERVREHGVVIPNPIRTDLPLPYSGERKKEFVAVGRLTDQKNYPLMLRAYARAHTVHPEWKLRIFGAGEDKEKLIELCRQLGLLDSVEFCGFSENVVNEIRCSGAYLLSSDYEGISNAMLEALSLGLPCVCTDCPVGGARMFVKPGENGYLVPVGDENALAEKMLAVMEKPFSAIQLEKSALSLRDALSPKAIAQKWMECL